MNQLIKKVLNILVVALISTLEKLSIGRYVLDLITNQTMNRILKINHNGEMKFNIPNTLNYIRAKTFSTKEPETLEWIDNLKKDSVFWDIGANIGLYSIYAAKQKNCRVFSFEPSVFNLELLARNIWLNDLTAKITIVPLPLSNHIAINKLNMSTMVWGGALSTFGSEIGHDGKNMKKMFEFVTIGLSMEDAVNKLKIPAPDYIKMDVDGIEHLILSGGKKILSTVQGIIVEVNDDFREQADTVNRILIQAGFKLKEKKHSEMIENSDFRNTFNQIWVKK